MKNLLTSPFGLEERLKPLSRDINIFALLNVALVVLGFLLLSSHFILAPGILIELPSIQASNALGIPAYHVLTVNQQNMILYKGRIYGLENLLQAFIKEQKKEIEKAILLIKLDKNTSMEIFLQVCEVANKAGYEHVQIAALPRKENAFSNLSVLPGMQQ